MNEKEETNLENASEYSLAKMISYGSLWFTDATILAFFGLVGWIGCGFSCSCVRHICDMEYDK